MGKHKPEFSRARIDILSYVASFCISYTFQNGTPNIYSTKIKSNGYGNGPQCKIGSLVFLSSTIISSKWCISWCEDFKEGSDRFDHQYLLRSIEDGTLSWWSNISIVYIPPEDIFPSWRFDDDQYAFVDKLRKIDNDVYVRRFKTPIFNGLSVSLETRRLHGDETIHALVLPNYKKATVKELKEFLLKDL